MELLTIGSSSSGNSYLIYNESECLILEAGINLSEIKKALDFDLSTVIGCISSHSHGDHSKFIDQYAKAGIEIYAHESVFSGRKPHHNYKEIKENKVFKLGDFSIKPFELTHDVPCFGFYINHPDTGNFCFITDTSEIPYRFAGLNHILVESNYDTEIIDTNDTNYILRDRIVNSHLSFDLCKDFISRQDLSNVQNIVLLHASDTNSDIMRFRNEVSYEFVKDVYVAKKGLKIDFNINPF
jgi:phosphoribosyl 1,2-cyclic phosphodiesterase